MSQGKRIRRISSAGCRQAGHEQEFHTGTPHIRDKYSQDTGNINKDKQLSDDAR